MNWLQYYEQNKNLGFDEALRQYRVIERKRNDEEYEAWVAMNEARAASANAAGAAGGGGGTAVGTALLAPDIVAIANDTDTDIYLYWGTAVHADNYIVQRATNEAFSAGVTQVYAGDSPVQLGYTYVKDTGRPINTTYYYRVKAQDTTGTYLDSPYGAIAKVTTSNTQPDYGYGGLALGLDNL